MVVAVAVLGALTFLAVVKVLQPTLLARRARRLDDEELRRAAPFLRRRDAVLPASAFAVCVVACGSAFASLDGSWTLWVAAAGAAVALGAAGRGSAPRVDAVLRARGVPLGDRPRYVWLDLTTALFAATWIVRLLATHAAFQPLAVTQLVLLPALTVCAGVATWVALRDPVR